VFCTKKYTNYTIDVLISAFFLLIRHALSTLNSPTLLFFFFFFFLSVFFKDKRGRRPQTKNEKKFVHIWYFRHCFFLFFIIANEIQRYSRASEPLDGGTRSGLHAEIESPESIAILKI
jgi:hypothetical protein